MLNMKEHLTPADQKEAIKHIKEYIKVFAKQSSGYLDNLVEMMKTINKKIFFEILVIVIEELNNCGKKCLEERKKYCRYHSLIFFEKAYSFFKKYIGDFKSILICSKEIREKCKSEVAVSDSYIRDINSNAILLTEIYLKPDNLIKSNMTGFTTPLLGLKLTQKDEQEKYQIVLKNYEKMLLELSDKVSLERALCIASIIKIAIRYLGESNYAKYMKLGESCEFLAKELHINKNEQWYMEFEEIYKEIKENYESLKQGQNMKRDAIKKDHKKIFDEIDSQFQKKKGNIDFINYILKLKPYPGYEEDKKNNKVNFNEASQELIAHLQSKNHPDNYKFSLDDEESLLNYFIIEYIMSYLNKMYKNIE